MKERDKITSAPMLLIVALLTCLPMLILILCGCSAYNSLIGHPLHVLWQEHQNVQAEQRQQQRDIVSHQPTNSITPAIIYRDCDARVDTNWVSELAKGSGTNFLGVYKDMAAVWHPEDGMRYAGVAMFSTCPGYQGEYLKDISSPDFEAIFVNKTKPEYSK